MRPIIGVRNRNWEFIVNPIVDFSTGTYGRADFVPAVRIACKLGNDFDIGVEYYGDLGICCSRLLTSSSVYSISISVSASASRPVLTS
jgi:hypothetical protein